MDTLKINMETYQQLKSRQQREINSFPLYAAFSREQFFIMLEKLGVKDKSEVISLGSGAFIHVKNKEAFIKLMNRHFAEMNARVKEDKKGDAFIYQMFLYELQNHEFGYTRDDTDTLQALDLSSKDFKENPALQNGLNLAKKSILI